MVEQEAGAAGVFGGDAVDGGESAEGAQGDIVEVADGCRDKVDGGLEFGVGGKGERDHG